MKHEESREDAAAVIDYFAKLCKNKKIVWLNDLNRKDRKGTPDFVRMKYLSGNIKGILNSDYALGNDLRCVTVELGEVKKKSMIVFNTDNEDYVKRCLKDFKKMKDELERREKDHAFEVDRIRRKMLKIGGRYE